MSGAERKKQAVEAQLVQAMTAPSRLGIACSHVTTRPWRRSQRFSSAVPAATSQRRKPTRLGLLVGRFRCRLQSAILTLLLFVAKYCLLLFSTSEDNVAQTAIMMKDMPERVRPAGIIEVNKQSRLQNPRKQKKEMNFTRAESMPFPRPRLNVPGLTWFQRPILYVKPGAGN